MIQRHGVPNKYDQFSKGTLCAVETAIGVFEYYEQKNEDEENPKWELVDLPSEALAE